MIIAIGDYSDYGCSVFRQSDNPISQWQRRCNATTRPSFFLALSDRGRRFADLPGTQRQESPEPVMKKGGAAREDPFKLQY